MNASNLMINDWVMFQDQDTLETEMHQIEQADFTGTAKFFDSLHPCPITAEFFQANGIKDKLSYSDDEFWSFSFSHHDGSHDFYCKARFIDTRGIVCCEFFFYTFGLLSCQVQSIKLRYVHEFQHVLRVIGLVDLADNIQINKGGEA